MFGVQQRRRLVSPCDSGFILSALWHQPSHILRAHQQRVIILDLILFDKLRHQPLNIWTVREKDGQRVIKVCPEMIPEGLIGHAAGELSAIDNRQKPDHPPLLIIGFTWEEDYLHDPIPCALHQPCLSIQPYGVQRTMK